MRAASSSPRFSASRSRRASAFCCRLRAARHRPEQISWPAWIGTFWQMGHSREASTPPLAGARTPSGLAPGGGRQVRTLPLALEGSGGQETAWHPRPDVEHGPLLERRHEIREQVEWRQRAVSHGSPQSARRAPVRRRPRSGAPAAAPGGDGRRPRGARHSARSRRGTPPRRPAPACPSGRFRAFTGSSRGGSRGTSRRAHGGSTRQCTGSIRGWHFFLATSGLRPLR